MTTYNEEVIRLAERYEHSAIHILYDEDDPFSGHICWNPNYDNQRGDRARFFEMWPHDPNTPLTCPRQEDHLIVTPTMVLHRVPTTHTAWSDT